MVILGSDFNLDEPWQPAEFGVYAVAIVRDCFGNCDIRVCNLAMLHCSSNRGQRNPCLTFKLEVYEFY